MPSDKTHHFDPSGKGEDGGDREEFSPNEDGYDGDMRIRDFRLDVVSNAQEIPRSPGLNGGVAITGFVDVEKLISVGHRKFFIEKKLPFQIVILSTGGIKDTQ